MDDFILILKTKKECIYIKHLIEQFLKENLHLELNAKSKYYPDKMGVNYCGFRAFTTHKLLRLSSKKKIKSNVKFWNHLYSRNNLDLCKAIQQLNSWIGHSNHCQAYHLQQKVLNNCNFLFNTNTDKMIESHLINEIGKDSINKIENFEK